VSLSHASKRSLKTNAPSEAIWVSRRLFGEISFCLRLAVGSCGLQKAMALHSLFLSSVTVSRGFMFSVYHQVPWP